MSLSDSETYVSKLQEDQTKKTLSCSPTGLCEYIEKELPWSAMLITRSTQATPSFVGSRPSCVYNIFVF